MKTDISTFRKIKDLYGYAIAQEHVGRRVLMREFDISRSKAEEVLDAIREPSVTGGDTIVIDSIEEVQHKSEEGEYEFQATDPFGEPATFYLPEQKVTQMKRDYCMRGYTQKETALNAGIDKATFTEIKKALGWKHKSIPATEEEMYGKTAEEIAQDLAMEKKKVEARKELERKEKTNLRRDAKKWRKFDEVIMSQFKDLIGQNYVPPNVNLEHTPDTERDPAAAIVPTFDVHFGKEGVLGPDGTAYSKGEAERRLIDSTERLIEDLTKYNIEKVYLAFGSDFFHVDTSHGTTTGKKLNQGTAQDLDGTPGQIFTEGCDLMRRHVDMLRQVGPIDGLVVPGNHDRMLSVALMKYMEAVYENAEDVSIDGDIGPRKYRQYGNTLMGFDHGDGIRNNDILPLVMSEARDKVSQTEETVFFTGHLHHELKEDLGGAVAYQLGSPSGADRWHEVNGYTAAQEQMTAFVVRENTGMHAHLNYPVIV